MTAAIAREPIAPPKAGHLSRSNEIRGRASFIEPKFRARCRCSRVATQPGFLFLRSRVVHDRCGSSGEVLLLLLPPLPTRCVLVSVPGLDRAGPVRDLR